MLSAYYRGLNKKSRKQKHVYLFLKLLYTLLVLPKRKPTKLTKLSTLLAILCSNTRFNEHEKSYMSNKASLTGQSRCSLL